VRYRCGRAMFANAGNLHVFETLARRDRGACQHRLSQLSAHQFVLYAWSLRDVDRSLGGTNRGLHLQRADEDDDVDGHRELAQGRGCYSSIMEISATLIARHLRTSPDER
jgi:hypothetical protein